MRISHFHDLMSKLHVCAKFIKRKKKPTADEDGTLTNMVAESFDGSD